MRHALLILGLLIAAPLQAQDREIPARAILSLPVCADESTLPWGPDFVDLVRIELLDAGVEELVRVDADASMPGEHVARIALSSPDCGVDQHVLVAIDDVLTHKRVSRTLDLSDVDAALRSRALSIFVVELLRASWAELRLPSQAHPSVPVPRTILAAVRAREDAEAPTLSSFPFASGEASASVRGFVGASTALLGGELALVLRPSDVPLVLRLDGGAAAGEVIDRLGRIELGLAGGGVAIGVGARHGALALDLGPRVGVGVGWASGTPTVPGASASQGFAVVVTLAVQASLRVRLIEGVSALLGVEVGAPLVGLEALVDGAPVAGLRGAMLSARVGLTID